MRLKSKDARAAGTNGSASCSVQRGTVLVSPLLEVPDDELIEETRAFWDKTADDWDIQVGDEGDNNRIQNSDPVLWRFAGKVDGLTVLDAGCGTGYLSRKLRACGANVVGVNFSERMIEVARDKSSNIDYRVDSVTCLQTVEDISIDLIVSNYVLMDTPGLEDTVQSFHRVLKPGGCAVLVFSHPCFPADCSVSKDSGAVYHWPFPYFERRKCVDPPWAHFTTDFIWFHRPLSDYWKAFRAAGFDVVDFEEPRNPNSKKSFSVAFKLRKP